jgi:hypothetical protein
MVDESVGYQVEEETVERGSGRGLKDRSQSMLKGIVSVISSPAVVANLVS